MSVASLWEMAIKTGIGKLELSAPFDKLIPKEIKNNEINIIQIELGAALLQQDKTIVNKGS